MIADRYDDLHLYGRPDGPTFEHWFQKHQAAGIAADEIYRMIIDSASQTNAEYRRF